MTIEYEIGQLGERMGVQGLSLSPAGLLAFDVDGVGRVFLETANDSFLVYLSRPVPVHDGGSVAGALLETCHFSKGHPRLVQAGMRPDAAVLVCHIAKEQVTATAIESTVVELTRIMEGIVP